LDDNLNLPEDLYDLTLFILNFYLVLGVSMDEGLTHPIIQPIPILSFFLSKHIIGLELALWIKTMVMGCAICHSFIRSKHIIDTCEFR
jgi:hypothetical protein